MPKNKSRRLGGMAGRIQAASDKFVKAVKTPPYSALLQDFENEATIACGCLMARLPDSATDVSITFCPLHENAQATLDALEALLATVSDDEKEDHDAPGAFLDHDEKACTLCQARKAVNKANPTP